MEIIQKILYSKSFSIADIYIIGVCCNIVFVLIRKFFIFDLTLSKLGIYRRKYFFTLFFMAMRPSLIDFTHILLSVFSTGLLIELCRSASIEKNFKFIKIKINKDDEK